MKKHYLMAQDLYQVIMHAAHHLVSYREYLNSINVFPVRDQDTGNNVSATMTSILELSNVGDNIKSTLMSIADASLLGARGNSGLIYSQFFNSLVNPDKAQQKLSTKCFAKLASNAASGACAAVAEPVEGTILTVMTSWANKVNQLANDEVDDFVSLFKNTLPAVNQELKKTTEKLSALAKYNVVDAGAQSFVYFIEGMFEGIRAIDEQSALNTELAIPQANIEELQETHSFEEEPSQRYCTEAIIKPKDLSLAQIRKQLTAHGDSVVVSGRDNLCRLHIHTNDPVQLFAELENIGEFKYPKVDDMLRQYQEACSEKRKIALVTDSVADLPAGFIDDNNIYVIPINLMIDDKVYLDKFTINNHRFYELLKKAKNLPTTSMPDLKNVRRMFTNLQGHYDEIIAITMSKAQSGTNHLIKTIAKEFDNVTVIDSKHNSGSQGLLLMSMVEMLNNGASAQEITAQIEQQIADTHIFVAVDDMTSLIRSGRVNRATGTVAKLINVKPVVGFDEQGRGVVMDKAFSLNGAYQKIATRLDKLLKSKPIKRYCILYVNDKLRAESFKKYMAEKLGQEPSYMTEVCPVVGLHAGDGCVAIAIQCE